MVNMEITPVKRIKGDRIHLLSYTFEDTKYSQSPRMMEFLFSIFFQVQSHYLITHLPKPCFYAFSQVLFQ